MAPSWLLWSFVGFVLFYGPLTFAAAFGPGWLVSGTWQFTIIAGVLLAPLFITVIAGKPTRALVNGPLLWLLIYKPTIWLFFSLEQKITLLFSFSIMIQSG